jgi:hypothetical protein
LLRGQTPEVNPRIADLWPLIDQWAAANIIAICEAIRPAGVLVPNGSAQVGPMQVGLAQVGLYQYGLNRVSSE